MAREFPGHLAALAAPAAGDRVLVALSGGLDSAVLLHLLRFGRGIPDIEVEAAHFDHGMRPTSGADALWISGLTRAWGVHLSLGASERPCRGEEDARDRRYAFLIEACQDRAVRWLLTAHHADDQAETVLFRILRGTGIRGLAGIPARRDPHVLRPLLPFWRREVEDYAAAVGLTARTDPSNRDRAFARNALRLDVIPALERDVAPRLRRSLVRLGEHARQDEVAWREVLPLVLERLDLRVKGDRISVALPALAGYDSTVRARVLRELARRLGGRLGSAATKAALTFSHSGSSGRHAPLSDGLELKREFDRLVMARVAADGGDERLRVDRSMKGAGEFVIGGQRYRADWSEGDVSGDWVERFGSHDLAFPLCLREWRPGDRMRMPYGHKKLKKVFAEARVPFPERRRRAVLSDAAGRVLWVPGVARSSHCPPQNGAPTFAIGITNAQHP